MNILTYEDAYALGESEVGHKAFAIARLNMLGIKVPCGKIIVDYKQSDDIEDLVEDFECSSYAVRSSAVGEDSRAYSWAGCFDSYLNVKTEELENRIIKVSNSVHNIRAQIYQKLNPAAPMINKMAVLVQEYILADVSGVMFTANPINKNKHNMIIERQANSGSVVDGKGFPTTKMYTKNKISSQSIDDKTELLLLNWGLQIEMVFGCPMDIEWLRKKDKIFITQARPITNF